MIQLASVASPPPSPQSDKAGKDDDADIVSRQAVRVLQPDSVEALDVLVVADHSLELLRRLIRRGCLADLLAPLSEALFAESNPIPLKAVLATLELISDKVRLPLIRATEATRERLTPILNTIISAENAVAARPHYAAAA